MLAPGAPPRRGRGPAVRAGLLGLAVAAVAAAAPHAEPLRVGLVRSASAGPLYIAAAEGFFSAEGLDGSLRFLGSQAAVTAAVARGELDVGVAELRGSFYTDAAAHRLKIIASLAIDQAGFPLHVLLIGAPARRAGLAGVRDLPGRRIGLGDADSGARYGLAAAATRFGVDPASILLRVLPGPARALDSLARGEIDAALVPAAVATGQVRGGEALLRLSDFAVSQQSVVFTAAQTIEQRRALLERFMHAYQRGTAAYHFNFLQYDDGGDFIPGPAYARYAGEIARQAGVSAAVLAATRSYCDRRGSLDAGDLDRQVKFWQDQGKLDRNVSAGTLVDLSFIGEEATGRAATGAR